MLSLLGHFCFANAATPATRAFDVPAGTALKTLRQFSQQAEVEVLFPPEMVQDVRTNAVRGQLSPVQALEKMLDGTSLRVIRDEKSGALGVRLVAKDGEKKDQAPADSSPAVSAVKNSNSIGGDPLMLNPFTVSSEQDQGYQSMSTLSGSSTNEKLRNLPVSISILNQEFIEDIAATDVSKLFEYGMSTEFNGQYGIGLSSGDNGGNSVVVRGIQSPWQSRDGMIYYGVADSFNVENLEINRGSSGLIFGDGQAGGITNIVTKRARFGSSRSSLGARWDSEGSVRATLDYNRQIHPKAAIRLNLMASDLRDWRDTAYNRSAGAAIAVELRPWRSTRVSLSYEYAPVHRVKTYGGLADNFSTGGYVLGSGSIGASTPVGTQTIASAAAATNPRWTVVGGQLINLKSTATATFRQSTFNGNLVDNVVPSIIPRSQQWNGPSERYDHNMETYMGIVEHVVGKTALQYTFNVQFSERIDTRSQLGTVRRDVNPSLPNASGAVVANPYFDALYVEHAWIDQLYVNRTATHRLVASHDLDLGFTRQRLVASASWRHDDFFLRTKQEYLTPAAISTAGLTGNLARTVANRVTRRHYLRDGNGGALALTDRTESDFFPVSGQGSVVDLTTGSLLALGRYWNERILTTVGVRRQRYARVGWTDVTDANGVASPPSVTKTGPAVVNANTSWNYGIVFSPQPWWRVFANYGETYQNVSSGSYFNGEARLPTAGDGVDFGASLYLLKDRLTFTYTRFDNTRLNTGIGSGGMGVWGNTNAQALVDEMNALLRTNYTTALDTDTRDQRTRGHEFELIANPTRSWSLVVRYSTRDTGFVNYAPRYAAAIAEMKQRATSPAQYALNATRYAEILDESIDARTNWNFSSRYTFTQGKLRGLRLGAYAVFREGIPVSSNPNRPPASFKDYILYNAFTAYRWKPTPKLDSSTQLNVENLLNNQQRIGRGYTGYSYLPPIKFTLQNTLTF